jgi:2-methylcitrate dehydratase
VDKITQDIADFAASLRWDDIPEESRRVATEHILDSLGCAIRAEDADGAAIARSFAAEQTSGEFRGRLIGTDRTMAADMAAFINGTAIRYLDYSDTMVPGGHPSDMLAALLSVGAVRGCSGQDLIIAMVIAYEVFARFGESAYIRKQGYDQGLSAALGASAGLARLRGLTVEQIANAVALSAVACLSLRATRGGKLSRWKGSSTAEGVREAVFLTEMAAGGMDGPERPFDGRHGIFEVVTHAPFEFQPFPTVGGPFLTPRASLKYWPVEFNTQIAVWAAKKLREQAPIDQIAGIELGIYWSAWSETGSEPEKWDPQTRETADHSLPYIFARSFVDDGIAIESFDRDKYLDPAIRPVMAKITVVEDDEANAKFPGAVSMRTTATLADGEVITEFAQNAPGHTDNRMTVEQVAAKFRSLVEPSRGSTATEAALAFWSDLAAQPSILPGLELLDRA